MFLKLRKNDNLRLQTMEGYTILRYSQQWKSYLTTVKQATLALANFHNKAPYGGWPKNACFHFASYYEMHCLIYF